MGKEKDNQRKTPSSDSSEEALRLKLGDPFKGPEESIVGTIFVNQQYRIKSIISSVTQLIDLSSFNEDLEIDDFARQLKEEGITADIEYVFRTRDTVKKEVAGKNGSWYMLEVRPHEANDENDGVIITFVDVTELKETVEELAEKVETIKELQQQIIKNDVSERWRIGQFLHDDLGQTLISALFLLETVKNKVANREKVAAKDIDHVLNILRESATNVRDMSHEIVPVDIEEKGIAHAFNNFAGQLEKMHGIQCELEYGSIVDKLTNIEIATHLYRIAQEAAKNAAAHGDAEKVKVTLTSDRDYLCLKIEDDGTGFSDSAKAKGGMGVNIMRHRMELIGGTFEIKNTSGLGATGTTITCKIPMEKV